MTERKKESDEDKIQLVNWVNSYVKSKQIQITNLSQLSTGVVFCELLNILYPGKVPQPKVFIKPKVDFEVMQNFKLLASLFEKLGLKLIDSFKLSKGKQSDMLVILLYLKKLIQQKQRTGEILKHEVGSLQSSLIFLKTAASPTKSSSKGLSGIRQRISVSPSSRSFMGPQSSRPPRRLNPLQQRIQTLTIKKSKLLQKLSLILQKSQQSKQIIQYFQKY